MNKLYEFQHLQRCPTWPCKNVAIPLFTASGKNIIEAFFEGLNNFFKEDV